MYLNENELISILITNFNKEKFLKNCLNSVYRQNLKNFEIILFDDCSNDNSLKIIKNIKIKLILNKKFLNTGYKSIKWSLPSF